MTAARRRLIIAVLLAVGPAFASAQIHVPGDQPTLAAALAVAVPDTVIVLSGGVYPPVVLTQSVTILGDPTDPPRIRPSLPGEESVTGLQEAAVTLLGPGTGRVQLSNLILGGEAHGQWFSRAAPAVSGGGFTRLVLTDCEARGAEWAYASGTGFAADCVVLDAGVPLLVVSRSELRGGRGVGPPAPFLPLWLPSGGAGVRAPGTQLVLLDSRVRGGDGLSAAINPAFGCPTSCADVIGGGGGPGVVALGVHRAVSRASGGKGATVHCSPEGQAATLVCQAPDGPAIVTAEAGLLELPAGYSSDGAMMVGRPWTCTWPPGVRRVILLISFQCGEPQSHGARGVLFMDPRALATFFLGGRGAVFDVPPDSSLVGLTVVTQVYDQVHGLSRPVVQAVLPMSDRR